MDKDMGGRVGMGYMGWIWGEWVGVWGCGAMRVIIFSLSTLPYLP